MMKAISIITISLITGFLFSGCDWHRNQTIVGTGDVESMEVELSSFDGVSVTGTCNVEITIGETQSVEFYAQPDILDVLKYEVKDDILHIGFKPDYSVNTSEEIRAEIVIPSVSFIAVTGAGDFKLSGKKQNLLDIHITGTGNVDAFNLEADDCTIRISGTGNCDVNVLQSLDVLISGVGYVRYMGDPAVSIDISGVGNVTALNP